MADLEDTPEPTVEAAPPVPDPVKDLLIVKTIEGQPWTLEFLSERHLRSLPASGAGEAQRVLEGAFAEQFGVQPVVKVKMLASHAA